MDQKLAKQIEAQQKKLTEERQKLADLQAKAQELEIKRFQRLAKKVGLFEVSVSDEAFEHALRHLVTSSS